MRRTASPNYARHREGIHNQAPPELRRSDLSCTAGIGFERCGTIESTSKPVNGRGALLSGLLAIATLLEARARTASYAPNIRARFDVTGGADPLLRLVDVSTANIWTSRP